ncbi:MAG TPA: response regulator [Bacteroidota bacterium]|nr:response regulator [Bacteroidota bacterium]
MERPLHVLITEDEESFADVLAMELQETGNFRVTTAYNGTEGIERLKEIKDIDIVLMDFNLGDISGLQVLQWINEQKMETPVIMMTAAGTEEVAVEAMKLGAYDYVRKEHLEINHFPILLHGVYERYLFRKDKQARDKEQLEKEKMEAAVQMFQTTVRTIAHHINNALAIFKLQSSVCERNVQKMLDPTLANPLLKLVTDLRRQADTVESIVRSLVGISDIVYTKYAGDQDIIEIRAQLERNLERLKEQKVEMLAR